MEFLRPARTDELEPLLDLITAEQADPATATCYIGTERDGLRQELEDLGPAWPGSALVVESDGLLIGATVTDADTQLRRSWIQGPWVIGAAWARWAQPLVEAAIAACPPAIREHEISADVANVRMAALARQLGWRASVPNHVFVIEASAAQGWPPGDPRVRTALAADAAWIGPLHDAEFPDTYLSASAMIAHGLSGERITLVSEADGELLGYASGWVQPDGSGYLDYLAVSPHRRGNGAGVGLLATIGSRIMAAAPKHDVNLTVQAHRSPAIALYRALGFTLETTIVGYSSPKL